MKKLLIIIAVALASCQKETSIERNQPRCRVCEGAVDQGQTFTWEGCGDENPPLKSPAGNSLTWACRYK